MERWYHGRVAHRIAFANILLGTSTVEADILLASYREKELQVLVVKQAWDNENGRI